MNGWPPKAPKPLNQGVDAMYDSKETRDILSVNGLFQAIDGSYVSASMIGKIFPDRKAGTAVCKDRSGNRIAIIFWPIDHEQ